MISSDLLRKTHDQYYIGPRMVLAASGVEHGQLIELGNKYFGVWKHRFSLRFGSILIVIGLSFASDGIFKNVYFLCFK